jgi:hypothetical protein
MRDVFDIDMLHCMGPIKEALLKVSAQYSLLLSANLDLTFKLKILFTFVTKLATLIIGA